MKDRTPSKASAGASSESPRRSTRARKTLQAPPVEEFKTPRPEDLNVGYVWALYDDEQLPTSYAVVRGVRRDADGWKVKVKWLKMREEETSFFLLNFFHEVDEDEEETDQVLEAFSHSAQRSLGAQQSSVRIAPCTGEVWAFLTSSNDGVRLGFVLYEIIEVADDRCKCAVLIRDEDEDAATASMSAWMRSPHHELVFLFGGEDCHACSHRIPAKHVPWLGQVWLDNSALRASSSDEGTAPLEVFEDADGNSKRKLSSFLTLRSDKRDVAKRRRRLDLTAKTQICTICDETVCGHYTLKCSTCPTRAHPWCVPKGQTIDACSWRCSTCHLSPTAVPWRHAMGKEKLPIELDVRHIQFNPGASSVPQRPSQTTIPCIKLGSDWVSLADVAENHPERKTVARALVAHISSIGNVSIGSKTLSYNTQEIVVGKRTCQKIHWMFHSNDMPFGITQYFGLLHESEICAIEQTTRKMHEECDSLDPKQVVRTPAMRRTKVFFRSRYVDYGSNQNTKVLRDVPDNAPHPIEKAEEILKRILGRRSDMIVCNMYNRGGSIGVHTDDKILFQRPIVSLRVGSPSVLTFGSHGLGAINSLFRIPLERGVVTSMEGLAANFFTHNIDGKDTTDFSTSILFRMLN